MCTPSRFKNYFEKFTTLAILLVTVACQGQTKISPLREVGGRCEGCEALYEYGNKNSNNVDTIPGFKNFSPKMKISGTIYQKDGVTPAENVILYIYHTNPSGIYDNKGQTDNWIARHGIHRGWIKTDKTGYYEIYTFRPGAYPNRQTPEHIHLTIKEPNTIPYYIDDILFTDDAKLSSEITSSQPNRGGNGIVTPVEKNGILVLKRDIVLGLNIPNY